MSQAGIVSDNSSAIGDVTQFTVQSGTSPVKPTAGNVNFNGAVVAAGTHPVRTDGTASDTMALEVQISQAIAASDATKIGLSNFNSADFTVDANGFVSLKTLNLTGYVSINHALSPYTVQPGDYFISCDSSGGTISILFPNAPTQYEQYIVKDRTGSAATFAITLTTVGGAVLIDGATSQTLVSNLASTQLLFNGTSYEEF